MAAALAAATMATLTLDSTVKLRSGAEMPLFGLGTWLSEGDAATDSIVEALKYGYRLIDTATMYKNHNQVKAALEIHPANKPYLVSKLSNEGHGHAEALAELDKTLEELGVEQLDLWLMHSPSPGKVVETWKAMLEARDAGKVKDVGVSNFGPAQMEGLRLLGLEAPAVNQFELHCFNQQRATVEYCQANGIVVMGFCPLARCKLFGQTPLAAIAEAHGVSEAACAIRWLLQKRFVTIPKSTNAARIHDNAAFGFELSDDAMRQIDALEQGFQASNACRAMDLPWDDVK